MGTPLGPKYIYVYSIYLHSPCGWGLGSRVRGPGDRVWGFGISDLGLFEFRRFRFEGFEGLRSRVFGAAE